MGVARGKAHPHNYFGHHILPMNFLCLPQSMLCQYHATHVLKIPGFSGSGGGGPDTPSHLPSLLLEFLRDVITILDPELGRALITSLTVSGNSPQYISNNESLQFVYLDCIGECLEALETLKVLEKPENDSDSQYESDHASSGSRRAGAEACERAMAMVYTLLSMVCGSAEMMRLTKKVETVFHALLRASYSLGVGPPVKFDVGRIYGCLLGRPNTFLISRLQEVEEFLRLNGTSEERLVSTSSSLVHASTPHRILGGGVGGSRGPPPGSEVVKAEWRDRFYSTLFDHQHLLETVLDKGLHFIYTGNLRELATLMSKPEYVPLRPVLLLLGWDRYTATGSGKELLDVLWPMEVRVHDQTLFLTRGEAGGGV